MLRLKKIELFGFKSFCDRQELLFGGQGVASVVGPNGCGKSNISDSISWVLGEQSAKTLRGSRMQDVIFNGSRDRKPSGMATVSMTLFDPDAAADPQNAGGKGRPGEITVVRKLLRSGESVYQINGRNCRLRDVHELFMGTGLGPNHYAIIEQGRIGQVLSSKPLDRRAIIEEAAGVTKFKSKKRLAELKLESARQNLNRVNDILQEVTRQVNSLKRQASKAKRWEELREELTTALSAVLANQHRKLATEISGLSETRLAAEKEFRIQAQRGERIERELGDKRTGQKACENELEAGRQELSTLTVESERRRSRIEQQARMVEENRNRKRHADSEIVAIDERLAELKRELAAEEEAVAAVQKQSGEIQQRLGEKNRELEQSQGSIRSKEQEQEAARKRVLALMGEASQMRNQLAKIEEFLAGNDRQVARAKEEQEAAGAELEQVAAGRKELAETEQKRKAELAELQGRAKEVDAEIGRQREEARQRRQRADELQRDVSRLRARHESLDEILSHHAYTTETVKTLFQAIDRGKGGDLKPVGILADIVDVSPEYERAAEEFLREELEYVVVRSWNEARGGVELLRSQGQGRATFLVEPESPELREPPALGPETGVIGRLADHIQLQNGLSDSASTLLPRLRGCYLVQEEAVAQRLATRYPDLHFLLPNGVCYRGYTVSGGRERSAGPLALKRELRELKPKLAAAEKAHEENRAAAAKAEERIGELGDERDRVRHEIQTTEKALVSLDHERRRLDDQAGRAERRAKLAGQDVERLTRDAERARGESGRLQSQIDQREKDRTGAEETLERLKGELQAAQSSVRSLAEEQTRLRTEAAALEERRRSAHSSLARMRSLVEEQTGRRERVRKQAETWEADAVRLVADNAQLEVAVRTQDERKTALQARVRELTDRLERLRDEVGRLETEAKTVREEVEKARQTQSRLELKLVELQADRRRLAETAERELKKSIEEIAASCPDELSQEDLEAAEAVAKDVREKIERLGPVNVLALEEFEEARQRQEFLETQQSDLLDSIRDTQQAIHEIDAASKRQFAEAFEQINKNFIVAFQSLFGGGAGEMRLTDPENPGESGIDIVASPPGKRLQNVALLSGGEKSLTALALLMATFQYKPSPFCVLDEVDAALDEANLIRMRRMIEQMSDRTQFIVITHSKTTMSAASTLYGVTMQEPGVSKIVSVRLGEHARQAMARSQARQGAPVGVG